MDKKNSSIFKIVIWSIIALFLISVLVSGIKFGSTGFFSFNLGGHHYFNSSKYSSGNNEIDASDISDIEINWIDGSVNVEGYSGDTVKFYEESRKELSDSDLLHYYSDGKKLSIEYSASRKLPISIGGFNFNKSLTIQIPESMMDQLKDLTIESFSSDINIKNVDSKYINVENISGELFLDNITVDEIDVDTTSGDIDSDNIIIKKASNMNTISGNVFLNGSISAIDFDSTSGELKVVSDVCPNEVDADTTSGNVTLSIPDNNGFNYTQDGVSGDIKCDFPTTGDNGEGKYGNGEADFSFDTISGDVYISKNKI